MAAVLHLTAVVWLAVGAAGPTASAKPARPSIRASIEREVDAVVRAHLEVCAVARDRGVPCFPVSLEQEGPRFSVEQSLRSYRPSGGPTSGPPTTAELQRQMPGAPRSAVGGVTVDPVCAVKSLVRLFKGSPHTFFLYRVWNGDAEGQPLLSDQKLDPAAYASLPAFRYEPLGEFKSECAALAAWRAALRESTPPAKTGAGDPPP